MASAPITQFGYSIDLDTSDLSALLKPVPTATPEQRKRRDMTGQGNSFAQNFMMLSPLTLLAACGSSGGVTPPPPPPPPSSTFTATADTATVTASATASATVTGNVITNDMPNTATVSAVGAGTAVPAGGVGTAIVGTLGTLNVSSTGAFTYTVTNKSLGDGVTGTDVFTYTGANGTATGSSTVTVTVTGVNDAPVAANDTANAVIGGAVVTANVLTNDSDVDRNATGGAQTLTVTAVASGATAPATGGVGTAIVGTFGTLNVAANGAYTYTPNATGTGTTDTFTYRVSDGVTSSTATLTVSFPAAFGTSVNLSSLGNAGIAITGPGGSSEFGASIAIGNVTGTGASIIVGAPGFDSGTTNNLGRVYVLGANGSLTGATTIDGVSADARLGTSVDVGNVGGSATADLILGSPGAAPNGTSNQGAAYILFGGTTIATNLGGLTGANGFLVSGSSNNTGGAYNGQPLADPGANDSLGYIVRYLGDINGDGRADYLLGVPGHNSSGAVSGTDAGAALVGYGLTTYAASYTFTDFVSTTTVIGFAGRIDGTSGTDREYVASDAASGNFNATTRMVAYSSALFNSGVGIDNGQVNVVLSTLNPQGGFLDSGASGFNGTTGFRIIGASGDKLGTAIAIGDLDANGIGDIVIGAPGANAVYILYNVNTVSGANIDLGTLTGNSGTISGVSVVKLTGASGSLFGSDVAVADFNGDGRSDIAVSSDGTGDAHIIFGRGAANMALVAAAPLGTAGVQNSVVFVDGPAASGTNFHLTLSTGDVNADGRADLAIGASSTGGAGAAYIVYGAATGAVPASLGATPIADAAPATVDSILDGLGIGLGGQRSGSFAVAIDPPIHIGTDFTGLEDMHHALLINAA